MFAMTAWISMPPCASASTLKGTVRLGADPIPEAWVVLTDRAGTSRSMVTNATGHYAFEDLKPGRYTVVVDGDLHSANIALCIFGAGETIDYDLGIELEPMSCDDIIATENGPADLDLMDSTASGQVLDEHGRCVPFADVTLKLSKQVLMIQADADGHFGVTVPFRDRAFEASAIAPGYDRGTASSSCGGSVIVHIYPTCPRC